MRARFILSEMLIGLRRNLTMTFAVVLTVAVSMSLLAAGLLVKAQVSSMKGYWYDRVEVSVFLCADGSQSANCNGAAVTPAQRQQIADDLNALPVVQKVYYESQQQAYERFKQQFKDSPDLVKNVTPDALPESYRVKLADPTQFDVISSAIGSAPGVDSVSDQRALLSRFFKVLNVFTVVSLVVAGVAIGAAVLLIFNTIRLAAFSRRRETSIMRLVGASTLYIQLPFLLEGALAGFVGTLVAVGALALLKAVAIDRLLKPALTFTSFVGWDSVASIAIGVVVFGTLLASLAAFLTLSLSKAVRT